MLGYSAVFSNFGSKLHNSFFFIGDLCPIFGLLHLDYGNKAHFLLPLLPSLWPMTVYEVQ